MIKRLDIDWEGKVTNILKMEMLHHNVKGSAELVKKLQAIGVNTSKASIDNKLSRGTFSAIFFVQCLVALGVSKIEID